MRIFIAGGPRAKSTVPRPGQLSQVGCGGWCRFASARLLFILRHAGVSLHEGDSSWNESRGRRTVGVALFGTSLRMTR